ncbi:uncharacterized protein LOC6539767 isoform X1 [Drosophila yakuba]|uniref:uncharacterized protein LOC6539767 isoform X1 n=1 Tax=Drosophila yakuba TaxID=7245 RepID=UPI0019307CDB|nr:uncharacterized protein LOC6539767 isoform X1 [Drosophila yakuba]
MVKKKNQDAVSQKPTVELLSEDEWMARRNTYMQRLADLKTSVAFIDDAIEEHREIQKQKLRNDKWNSYLACDGLPNPSRPAEIRKFIFQLNYKEQEACANEVSWVLSVNDRSVLSQAPNRDDMTRKNLEKLRPNIGQLYDETVQKILATIERVGRVLRNDDELVRLPTFQVLELDKIPNELYGEIDRFLDKLTYRVVCSPDALMTNKDSILSSYCYNCSNFDLEIWGLQDVPIRFNYLKLPLMHSNLNCVGVTIQLPLSVLCDNLTLRCVRTFFDPLSHLAKSFELVIDSSMSPNCGLVDIGDSVMSEWMTQMDIQEELMTRMESEMRAYNEAISFIADAEAKEKKKPQQKRVRIPKPPKRPQELPTGMFPDPHKIFLEHEKRDCSDFFNRYFHPDNINLQPSEVNLRRFIIIGGIVSLVFVQKAKHTAFEKCNITLHEDGRLLRKSLNILDGSKEEESSRRSTKSGIGADIKRNTVFEEASDVPLHLEPNELPYYFLTFKVPDHLCIWGEPMVCQFFESEIERPQEVKADELVKKVDKKKKYMRKSLRKESESVHVVTTMSGPVSTVEERSSESNKPTYHQPARENSINIYRPSALAIVRQSAMETEQTPYESTFKNFKLLGEPISRRNLRLLQDQCLPRMISSLKFPLDFKDDKTEAQALKKTPAVQLYKRRLTDSVGSSQMEELCFNYEDQSNPERLYPKFPLMTDLHVKTGRIDSSKEDTTMIGLLRTLEDIKYKYIDAPRRIVEQNTYAVRMSKKSFSDPLPTTRSHRQSYFGRRSVRQLGLEESTLSVSRQVEIEYELSETSDTGGQLLKTSKDSRLPPQTLPQSSEPIKVAQWTTEFILESSFDRESKVLLVKTDRLGHFGFAYRRYAHFPFSHWELERNEQNPDEIILTLDTYHVRVVFFISKDGIRCHAIDIPKEYIARPFKYINIDKPISDFVELRKRLQDMNLNVFAELDACFYIDQGYFSQKHLAAELHVYDAIAVHIKLMKFSRSQWNRLARDRDILLCLRNTRDVHDGSEVTVRVTPEVSTFVEVSELCSDDSKVIKLQFKSTWRNIGTYSDLHQLINSMYPHATDMRNRDANQMYYLRQLLQEIRPLSFS